MKPALELRGVTKKYPGVVANDGVDLDLLEGEVHCLLGENGAGKSTLMNVAYGLAAPDSGEVRVRGEAVSLRSPKDAIALGVGMVHQHFMLVPGFTVAENVMLGAEELRGLALDRKKVASRVRRLSEEYGLAVDPDAVVGGLPVGAQQRVEIVKALYRNARILILDEPTAVLAPGEVGELLALLRRLALGGSSVLFITHKLREVLEAADRITVMRAGRVVASVKPGGADERSLASLMVGREVGLRVEKAAAAPSGPVLEATGLSVGGRHAGVDEVRGVSFSVRAGEILGVAGVQGNGQTELVEAVTGLRPPRAGRVLLSGVDVTGAAPRELIGRGVSHVPEDRQRHGLVLSHSVADNLVLCAYDRPPFAARGVRREGPVGENARRLIGDFDVRAPGPFAKASTLSGGNQQKVIVARELGRKVTLLVANQPTRGVDVGSIERIHRAIVAARDGGAAVLLVSAELDEILALSDRIAVMYRGQIVSTVPAEGATREGLGGLMAGAKPPAEAGGNLSLQTTQGPDAQSSFSSRKAP